MRTLSIKSNSGENAILSGEQEILLFSTSILVLLPPGNGSFSRAPFAFVNRGWIYAAFIRMCILFRFVVTMSFIVSFANSTIDSFVSRSTNAVLWLCARITCKIFQNVIWKGKKMSKMVTLKQQQNTHAHVTLVELARNHAATVKVRLIFSARERMLFLLDFVLLLLLFKREKPRSSMVEKLVVLVKSGQSANETAAKNHSPTIIEPCAHKTLELWKKGKNEPEQSAQTIVSLQMKSD